MRLSDEKISHLTHVVLRGLIARKAVTPLVEEGIIRREMRRIITKELKLAEDVDALVRKKLDSYSKKILEGTAEWNVLYQRFFQEEMNRRGRG